MDRKNTLLLTVIAIATLLVAVVGATFAYFTAQNGKGATATAQVTTSSVDTATMSEFTDLTLQATQFNFGKDMGSLYAESEGSIAFTANADNNSEYCYKVNLTVSNNNFEYSLKEGSEKPELIFSISKGSSAEELTPYSVSTLGKGETTLTYKADAFGGETSLCKYKAPATEQSTECSDDTISGYDITTRKSGTIEIPNGPTQSETENDAYIHKISATKGKTVTDYWKARITFVNYDDDQQKNAQLSEGVLTTGKTFSATVNFEPVKCGTGESLLEG